ncbi:CCNE1 protein, partial [Polyodon spathula]|nr:CCNE1 protein [Polyodon spathula]
PCRLIPTPDKEVDEPVVMRTGSCMQYRFKNIFVTPVRASPLPVLGWANKDDVWNNLLKKDKTYLRDKHFMERHPHLQPKMRAILLDWLMEASEIYPPKLHQFTYVTDGACTEDEILDMELIVMKVSLLATNKSKIHFAILIYL